MTAYILACICLGLPTCILGLFVWDCWMHQREADRAARDMEGRQ